MGNENDAIQHMLGQIPLNREMRRRKEKKRCAPKLENRRLNRRTKKEK